MKGKNIWRLYKIYGCRIDYPMLKPHDLRRGVAMEVYEQHNDLEEVRALLGHTRRPRLRLLPWHSLLVAIKPGLGAAVVMLWLWGIIANLLLILGYYDGGAARPWPLAGGGGPGATPPGVRAPLAPAAWRAA